MDLLGIGGCEGGREKSFFPKEPLEAYSGEQIIKRRLRRTVIKGGAEELSLKGVERAAIKGGLKEAYQKSGTSGFK